MNPLWLWMALAFGQDAPAPEPTPPSDGVDAGEEGGVLVVRVYGPDAIRAAREAVVRDMEAQGWSVVSEQGGEVIFRGPSNWMGRAVLDPQGTMRFTTPAAAFQSVGVDDGTTGTSGTPLGQELPGGAYQGTSRDPGTAIVPTVSFALYPKRKARTVHDDVLVEVTPELAAYRDALQETVFQEQLEALSDRLDALWELGVPLEAGKPRVETIDDRRRAVLTFWATRAATPQGLDTCKEVELWLSEIVQTSTDPVTPDEQEEANARAEHGRRLALIGGPG